MGLRWKLLVVASIVTMAIGLGTSLSFVSELAGRVFYSDSSGAVTEEDEDFGSVELYDVEADGSLFPEPVGQADTVWTMFLRVAGADEAARVISEFRVGDSADSDTLAYVYQSDDPDHWVLATNLAGADDASLLLATLIHEYAHIITLGVDEVDPYTAECDTLSIDEGCAMADSVIEAFEAEFWAGYGAEAPATDNTDSDIAWEFYLKHEEDFVSDYAATNPVEDLAESFTSFVLEDDWSTDTVAGRKLEFFTDFDWLVAERDRLRAEFAVELGLD